MLLIGVLWLARPSSSEQLEVEVGANRYAAVEFDAAGDAPETLRQRATAFAEAHSLDRGLGCDSKDCVAATLCASMAQVSAQRRFEAVETAVATRDAQRIADAADSASDFADPSRSCGERVATAAANAAGRLAALAEASAANWLGPDGVRRGVLAARRAVRFSESLFDEDDDFDARQQLALDRRVLATFEGLWDTSFAAFEQRTYGPLCDALSRDVAAEHEGGLFLSNSLDKTSFATHDALQKRECWVTALLDAAPVRHAIEVGFNAGHSAAMLLALSPAATLEVYDLCRYDYTLAALHALRQHFPRNDILFLCGDSTVTLADRARAPPRDPPLADFVFVDAAHTFTNARQDLTNARRRARHGATVVLDDCSGDVYRAWTSLLADGLLADRRRGVCWRGLCVGRFL